MSQFIIERKSQDNAMKYKMVVRINGGEKIELLPGEQKEIDLTDGSYEVVASLNLQKKALRIEMPQENKVIISFTNGVQIESPNRAKEYDLGATSAPIVEKDIEEPIVASSETVSEASASGGNKMYCTQCGGQIEENAKFCKHCGNKVNSSIPVSSEKIKGSIDSVGIIRIILFLVVAFILSFVEFMIFGANILELLAGIAIALVVASVIYAKMPKGIQGIGSILAFIVSFFVYIGIVGGVIDVEESIPLFFILVGIPLVLFNVLVLVIIASSTNKN